MNLFTQSTLSLLLVGILNVAELYAVDLRKVDKLVSDVMSQGIDELYYGLSTNVVLGKPLPSSHEKICKKIDNQLSKQASLADLYYSISINKILSQPCKKDSYRQYFSKIDVPQDETTAMSLFHYLSVQNDAFNTNKQISLQRAFEILLNIIDKKDITDSELGYCLQAGVFMVETLTKNTNTFEAMFDKAVSRFKLYTKQMASIDDDVYTLITGIIEMTEALKDHSDTTLDKESVLRIASFIQRPIKFYTIKDACNVIHNADKFTSYALPMMPVKISFIEHKDIVLDISNSTMFLVVSDLIDRPIDQDLRLRLVSLSTKEGNDVVTDIDFQSKDSQNMVYSLTLPVEKLKAGHYKANVEIVLSDDLDAAQHQVIPVTIKIPMLVESISFKVHSSSDNNAYLLKNQETLPADILITSDKDIEITSILKSDEELSEISAFLCFELKELATKDEKFSKMLPHYQTCIRMNANSTNQYYAHINGNMHAARCLHKSGIYNLNFIAHHRLMSSSIVYKMGEVKITYDHGNDILFGSVYQTQKTSITHVFTTGDPRPPMIISSIFTGAVFVPLVLLPFAWMYNGANLSKCPCSISVPIYHIAHTALIAGLLYCWVYMNMFDTIKLTLVLSSVMFIFGRLIILATVKH